MEPEETVKTNQFTKLLPLLGVAILLAVLLVGGYLFYNGTFGTGLSLFSKPSSNPAEIITYEDCVQAADSQLFPEEDTCLTSDGRRFILRSGTTEISIPDYASPIPLPDLIQVCPEEWISEMALESGEQTPTIFPDGGSNQGTRYVQVGEYLVIDGQRRSLAEVDMDWVRQNCSVSPTSTIR